MNPDVLTPQRGQLGGHSSLVVPRQGRPRPQAGFTLIEVLLSMTIGLILLVPVGGWMIMAMQQHGPTAGRFSEASQARIANTYLSRDVGSAELVKVADFGSKPGCGDPTDPEIAGDAVFLQLVDDVDDGTEVPARTVYVTNSADGVTSVLRRTCGLNDTTVVKDQVRVLRDVSMTPGSEPSATCTPVTDDPLTDCRQVTFTAVLAGGAPVNVRAMRRATLDASFLGSTGNLAPRARITRVSQGGMRPNYTVVLDSASSSDPDGTITSRSWDVTPPNSVPPGSVTQTPGPSSTQVTFTFAYVGTYQVTLTVGDGTNTVTERMNITVDNQAPVAKLGVVENSSEGRIQGGDDPPHTFKFDAGESYDPDDVSGVTYDWDFGPGVDLDSAVITGATAAVQYKPSPASDPLGDREVKVTVTDALGATAVARVAVRLLPADAVDPIPTGPIVLTTTGEPGLQLVNTPPKLPRAGTVGPGRGPVNVTFTTNTAGPFTWELRRAGGTEPVDTSTTVSFTHAFADGDAGDWEILLTPDGGGAPSLTGFRLNAAPVVGFGAAPVGSAPTEVAFNSGASSDDGAITGYLWNFGFFNNWISTVANPKQLFTHPGVYDVTLVVVDDDGASTFKTLPLSVPGTIVAPAPGTFEGNVYRWTAVPGAQDYGVHIAASGGSGCPGPSDYTVAATEAPSFTTAYPGCSVIVTHRVRVSATWGPYSTPVTRP